MKTVKEYRALSTQDLQKELHELLKEQMLMRMQAPGEVPPHRFKIVRRSVARIKTLMNDAQKNKETAA